MEPNQNPPPNPPPSTPFHHHHDAAGTCVNCGGPTALPSPPPDPNPNYIPIRAPAVNLPPANNREIIIRTPVPQSQRVVPLTPPYHFQIPIKKIHTQDDIVRFQSSPTCHNFLGFVVSLSESVRSHKLSDPCHESPVVSAIVSVLQTLIAYVDEIPLAPQSSRYGNLAYRTWHERMSCDAETFMLQFLPPDLQSATVELVHYFTDSFGNSSRIDYGTGHETNFAAWLYCLARLGVVKEEDYQGLVSRVFVKYLELMRKLQITYCLEPAGSHGVWGLDDYHFLPFIFGSSQLIDHKYMKPKSIHNDDILENFSNEYLYLSCIVFIKKVKKGLFAEHSPMLDDISGVPNWNKVNSGLLKMYKIEVLQKPLPCSDGETAFYYFGSTHLQHVILMHQPAILQHFIVRILSIVVKMILKISFTHSLVGSDCDKYLMSGQLTLSTVFMTRLTHITNSSEFLLEEIWY